MSDWNLDKSIKLFHRVLLDSKAIFEEYFKKYSTIQHRKASKDSPRQFDTYTNPQENDNENQSGMYIFILQHCTYKF